MEAYPVGSLDPSIPLVVALGVSGAMRDGPELFKDAGLKKQGHLIRSDVAPIDSEQAVKLLRYLQEHDASNLSWAAQDPPTGIRYKFCFRTAERELLLPPRRAPLPDGIEPPPSPAVFHSPFSPLSPISPLYPNGLIDALWLQKHQAMVPSVLLCFYKLASDPTKTTLFDNQIKTDVASIKSSVIQSGYKTRLAVVLLAESSASSMDGVQDRIEAIRKGCGIDSKSLFLIPPSQSAEELERVAENMLTTLYPVAVDYYRDLGRHARKKRGRGAAPQPTIPPTSGTSQTLSLAGWNTRYDFKSAVFAEFRAESDTALRCYEQAYDSLLGPELLEAIPSWSPRWNEARLLADVISVRSISCLLRGGQYSAAVRRWQTHRDRIADIVDRRGRGTNNYGWKAWEARWTLVMAGLVEKASVADFAPSTHTLFLQPEKAVMAERLQPWEFLHHPGYWYRLAAKHLHARRALAQAIPDDDRKPPSFSPASQVASKAFTYDTYMCPDPHEEYPLSGQSSGVDHSGMIVDCLARARSEFLKRQQMRLGVELSLECARELAGAKNWQGIVDLLRPVWKNMPFRAEGWLGITEDLGWTLRGAAAMVGEASLVLAIDWELLHKCFTRRPAWPYDLSKSLEGISANTKPRIHIDIDDDRTLSFISTAFLFRDEEGKAGQKASGQLSITSNAHAGSPPITLKTVQVEFNGSLGLMRLTHKASSKPETQQKTERVVFSAVPLETAYEANEDIDNGVTAGNLYGTADLKLPAGQTVVFNVQIPLREPGETSAVSFTLNLEADAFDLSQYQSLQQKRGSDVWYTSSSTTKRISRSAPFMIRVLPRPPQMEIVGLTWKEQYYTDETLSLEFEVINEEEVDASAKLDVTLVGQEAPLFTATLPGTEVNATSVVATSEESKLSGLSLGAIGSSKSITAHINLPPIPHSGRYDLGLKVVYHLATNPGTPIIQTSSFQLNINSPFEANYDLLPRINADPWPSVFDYEGILNVDTDSAANHVPPSGISQTWRLVTRYASFATEELRVYDVDMRIRTAASVRCRHTKCAEMKSDGNSDGRIVKPKTIENAAFDIVAQRSTIDDRSVTGFDASLVIKWARLTATGQINTSTLPIPRFLLFGTEPRVLASSSASTLGVESDDNEQRTQLLLILRVVIENPSSHFLTFGLSMEPSDEFAFSGPKQTTLHLLPVSRRAMTYRLMPLVPRKTSSSVGSTATGEGSWIKPGLVVRDKYFQKQLRVIPTEGMKLDPEGNIVIWVPA